MTFTCTIFCPQHDLSIETIMTLSTDIIHMQKTVFL